MKENNVLITGLRKNTAEMLLLKILTEGDMYGYEIIQEMANRSNQLYLIKEGSLYPILYRLEEGGYITQYEVLVGKRRKRIYYHLEEEGYNYYQELVNVYHQFYEMINFILESTKGDIYEGEGNKGET